MKQLGISIILLLIGVIYNVQSELYEYGTSNGDDKVTTVNDGYKQINFTNGFPFYGYLFKKAYIDENGLVSMLTPVYDSEWIQPFPISGNADNNMDGKIEHEGADARVLIAPFWSNVDVTVAGNIYYRQITAENDTTGALARATDEIRSCFLPQSEFTPTFGVIVTWDEVSFFGFSGSPPAPTNTFQLVLVSNERETFATYIYDDIQWNAGTDGPGNPDSRYGKSDNGATIGFNVGDRYTSLSHSRSADDFNAQQGITSLSNCESLESGAYIYKIDETEMKEAGCKNGADLTVFPSVGSMFGGEKIFLIGPCWDSSVEIMCKFSYNKEVVQTVAGERIDNEKSVCVPDPFFLSSELTIEVSIDGGANYDLSSAYYVSNLDRRPSSGVTRLNTDWENWKTAGYELKISWESEHFEASSNVSIAVLIYYEGGTKGPRWEEVYDIAEHTENNGAYTFEGEAVSQVFEGNGFGAIRIRSADDAEGRTLWSDVHPLGYLLNQDYQDDPEGWSAEYCDKWAKEDKNLPSFVDDLLPCPCTLEQAIVDTGRFQSDVSCSMYQGSKCLYHQGAKHCVRSVAATDRTNSGSQCCYNDNGDLMYAMDTEQGSTSDRSHVWGAEPYGDAGMVPGLSHWYHDVMPFYFCCEWSENCGVYAEQRPTASCTEYSPPKTSTSFGDPHFVTFDGVEYTFNGKGEFTMLKEDDSGFELQVRTEQAKCSGAFCDIGEQEVNATVLTAIAMQETDSDGIHVELNPITELRFIRKIAGSTEQVDFYDQEWLDFNGVSVIVLESDDGIVHKATITYWKSGVGVNVTANGQTLTVGVTLPPSLKGKSKVQGLLGNWNDDKKDDLMSKNGNTLNPDTAKDEQILEFSNSWEVDTSYFYYEVGTHEDYQDNSFIPVFVAPDRSELPNELVADMDNVCDDNVQCIYDVSMTRDIDVGKYTMEALQTHELAQAYTVKITSCPYLPTPINATKEFKGSQQNYLAGATVVFTCAEGLELIGTSKRECSNNGKWSGEDDTECVEPGTGGGESSSSTAGIVVGVLVAIIVVIVIVVVIVVVLRKKGEQDPEAGAGAGTGSTKKEYKEVKMSEVDEDKQKAEPKEDEPMNLDEKTSAPTAGDD